MKRTVLTTILLTISLSGFAISADRILRRMDYNQQMANSSFTGKMTIYKGKRTLVKKFTGYGRRRDDRFFLRFTNPADRGVKYLKYRNQLRIYLPDADDVMLISGHLLRRGMMDSDISYEDLLEFDKYRKQYSAELEGTAKVDGRTCWKLALTAKVDDAPYYKQRLLVDKKTFVPLRIKLYARSGRLLKVMKQSKLVRRSNRWLPLKITVTDKRRSNSKTVVTYSRLQINVKIPDRVFTVQNLYR